jgi:hypothetical protein
VNTPWGKSDSKITIARGLSFVTTPSHGGFMVASGYAKKHLSQAAQARGLKYGGTKFNQEDYYLAFEEDCDYAIVMLEMHDFLVGVSVLEFPINLPTKEKLIESLSRWHADYLIEIGVTPTAEGLKYFNENRLQDRMRAVDRTVTVYDIDHQTTRLDA